MLMQTTKPTEKEPLFAEERQARMLQQLQREHKLLVPELCEQFGVSPATIRNDLNDMESRGLLKRTHGGAILATKLTFEQQTSQKLVKNRPQKEAIAKLAATLVEDGDTIALDTGTTTLAFARCLTNKNNLTVVTNDLTIAMMLEEQSTASVIVAGGLIRRGYHCTVGAMTLSCMQMLGVDKCFVAANAFSVERGITTPDMNQAEVKTRLASIGTQVILLCDSDKLDNNAFVSVLPAEQIHTMITDDGITKAQQSKMEDAGITVMVAKH